MLTRIFFWAVAKPRFQGSLAPFSREIVNSQNPGKKFGFGAIVG